MENLVRLNGHHDLYIERMSYKRILTLYSNIYSSWFACILCWSVSKISRIGFDYWMKSTI